MSAETDRSKIFMYSKKEHRTYRWLVDAAGTILEATTFQRADRTA